MTKKNDGSSEFICNGYQPQSKIESPNPEQLGYQPVNADRGYQPQNIYRGPVMSSEPPPIPPQENSNK